MAKKITPKKNAIKKVAVKTLKKATVRPAAMPAKKVKRINKSKPADNKKVGKKAVIAGKKVIPKVKQTAKKIVPKPKPLSGKSAVAKTKLKPPAKKAVAKASVRNNSGKKVVKKLKPKVVPKVVKPAKKKVMAPKKAINKETTKVTAAKAKSVKKVAAVIAKPAKKKIVVKAPVVKKKEIPPAKPKIAQPEQPKNEIMPASKVAKRPVIVPMKNCNGFEANFNRADMFYKNVLKAEIIKRYSCNKEEDKEFIDRDQNLAVKINDRFLTISEKTRDQDWNDIYVEIFKKYPDEDGWIRSTQADYLGYFFPGRVFWARMEPIKKLCFDILAKALDSGIYKELFYMFPKHSGRLSKTFKINTKTYSFNFIQIYHDHGDKSYYTIGISLPFVLLLDFRIEYKIYKQ